jgi:cyclic pyranopterin phosphate synthase
MVDVSAKNVTARTAVASARIWLPDDVMKLLDTDGEMRSAKGPVFATAIIAGTMACKRTHELIPFCHPLALESCKFRIVNAGKNEISIEATASISGKTGVEMEALTAVRYDARRA